MTEKTNLLSDNEVDTRLKEALKLFGAEEGQTTEGDAALRAAREVLSMLSIALIKAEVERDTGAISLLPNLKDCSI